MSYKFKNFNILNKYWIHISVISFVIIVILMLILPYILHGCFSVSLIKSYGNTFTLLVPVLGAVFSFYVTFSFKEIKHQNQLKHYINYRTISNIHVIIKKLIDIERKMFHLEYDILRINDVINSHKFSTNGELYTFLRSKEFNYRCRRNDLFLFLKSGREFEIVGDYIKYLFDINKRFHSDVVFSWDNKKINDIHNDIKRYMKKSPLYYKSRGIRKYRKNRSRFPLVKNERVLKRILLGNKSYKILNISNFLNKIYSSIAYSIDIRYKLVYLIDGINKG